MFTIKVRTGITEFTVLSANSFKIGKASEVAPNIEPPDGASAHSMCIRTFHLQGGEVIVLRVGQEAFIMNEAGRTIERLTG
jgi:hypothetical protein